MGQVNLHIAVNLVPSKLSSFRFMIKYYLINNELDIDSEFNKTIDDQINESDGTSIKVSWSGLTQQENLVDIIVDRWNFFIETGKFTFIDKQQGITEVKFDNGFFHSKTFNSHGGIIAERKELNKWDFGRYHILRYHLVQDLKDKLQNLDFLDLDSLAIEYRIDKGFLIDFIYSFINKNLVEISSDQSGSLLRVKSNLEQILNQLNESINKMEMDLVA